MNDSQAFWNHNSTGHLCQLCGPGCVLAYARGRQQQHQQQLGASDCLWIYFFYCTKDTKNLKMLWYNSGAQGLSPLTKLNSDLTLPGEPISFGLWRPVNKDWCYISTFQYCTKKSKIFWIKVLSMHLWYNLESHLLHMWQQLSEKYWFPVQLQPTLSFQISFLNSIFVAWNKMQIMYCTFPTRQESSIKSIY